MTPKEIHAWSAEVDLLEDEDELRQLEKRMKRWARKARKASAPTADLHEALVKQVVARADDVMWRGMMLNDPVHRHLAHESQEYGDLEFVRIVEDMEET